MSAGDIMVFGATNSKLTVSRTSSVRKGQLRADGLFPVKGLLTRKENGDYEYGNYLESDGQLIVTAVARCGRRLFVAFPRRFLNRGAIIDLPKSGTIDIRKVKLLAAKQLDVPFFSQNCSRAGGSFRHADGQMDQQFVGDLAEIEANRGAAIGSSRTFGFAEDGRFRVAKQDVSSVDAGIITFDLSKFAPIWFTATECGPFVAATVRGDQPDERMLVLDQSGRTVAERTGMTPVSFLSDGRLMTQAGRSVLVSSPPKFTDFVKVAQLNRSGVLAYYLTPQVCESAARIAAPG